MDFLTVVKRNRVVLPLAAAAALMMLLISESSHQNSVARWTAWARWPWHASTSSNWSATW